MGNRSEELESLRLFVEKLEKDTQVSHSELLYNLKEIMGRTDEFDSTEKVLKEIFYAKLDILNKIRERIQSYG